MTSPLERIAELENRVTQDAFRELAEHFADPDPDVRLAAAKVFVRYPNASKQYWAPLIAALTDERHLVPEPLARVPMRAAAHAAIEILAADSLDELLRSLLADDAVASDAGRVRAEAILFELEASLAGRFYQDLVDDGNGAPPPAPLLVDRCEQLSVRRDAIGMLARRCADGYRTHQGWFVAARGTEIHLGEGDDPPFPCAIAGFLVPFEMKSAHVREALRSLDDQPFGLALFQHATAGIALHYVRIAGFALRLTDEEAHLVRELATVIGHTSGEALAAEHHATWNAKLASLVPGGIDSAREALLVARPHSPLASLRGNVALVGRPAIPWHDSVMNPDENTFDTDGIYDGAREAALIAIGTALGLGAPRVMLLWGNSD